MSLKSFSNSSGRKIAAVMILIITVVAFCYYENNSITVTRININSDKIPKDFRGFKIVHISDLHGKKFKGGKLFKLIGREEPDIIAITGDIVDRRRFNTDAVVDFVNETKNIAPIFYVTGNHEWWSGRYDEVEKILIDGGINVLHDRNIKINRNVSSIYIAGIDDDARVYNGYTKKTSVDSSIKTAVKGIKDNEFKILLSHRPENFNYYQKYGFTLALCGHAHGGQIRLPFIGGLVAPGQGIFPKYTSGAYKLNGTTMVVSRGLGNSIAPLRIFNRPEIVVITLN